MRSELELTVNMIVSGVNSINYKMFFPMPEHCNRLCNVVNMSPSTLTDRLIAKEGLSGQALEGEAEETS